MDRSEQVQLAHRKIEALNLINACRFPPDNKREVESRLEEIRKLQDILNVTSDVDQEANDLWFDLLDCKVELFDYELYYLDDDQDGDSSSDVISDSGDATKVLNKTPDNGLIVTIQPEEADNGPVFSTEDADKHGTNGCSNDGTDKINEESSGDYKEADSPKLHLPEEAAPSGTQPNSLNNGCTTTAAESPGWNNNGQAVATGDAWADGQQHHKSDNVSNDCLQGFQLTHSLGTKNLTNVHAAGDAIKELDKEEENFIRQQDGGGDHDLQQQDGQTDNGPTVATANKITSGSPMWR